MPRFLTEYDRAQAQGMLWTPEALRPALWLDAADLSTITIATGVSEWRDKSGNARHASQTTGANQPAYSDFSFRGLPGITFDGGDRSLTFSGFAQANGHDVFAVADTTNMQTGARVMMNRSVGNGPAIYFGLVGSDYRPSMFWSSNLAVQASAIQRPALLRWGVYTGTAFTEVDGGSRASQAHAQTTLEDWAGIAVASATQRPTAVLSEIVIANSPTDAQAAALYGYLSWKWGIRLAADHPYANRPPLIGD